MLLTWAAAVAGCAVDDEAWDEVGAFEPSVLDVGIYALSSSDFRSINGTYGASCTGRTGQSWSVAVVQGATLDNAALSVAKGNTTCVLTLTGLRTATTLYSSTGLTLGNAYQASSASFSAAGVVALRANAKLSAATFASDFTLTVLVSADPTLASDSYTPFYVYETLIQNTSGLVSYLRLNEPDSVFVEDDFSGTSGALLSSRPGTTGATWTRDTTALFASTAVITDANRVRAQDSGNSPTVYLASGAPPSADYAVEGTIYLRTQVSDPDAAGVLVRASAGSHYFGGYWNQENDDNERWWTIRRCDSNACDTGTSPGLGYVIAPEATAGQSYTVRLEVSGSTTTTLKLYVNSVLKVTVTEASAPITSAGKVGIRLGGDRDLDNGWTSQSNTQGAHLDDIRAERLNASVADDAKGSFDGTYYDPSRGTAGALVGNSDTAVTFDGVDDYISASRAVADNFSIEFWFKTSMSTSASTNTHWFTSTNKGLFDASSTSSINDFGISMRPDGKVLAGIGVTSESASSSILSTNAYNNGAWHHLVFTRTKGASNSTLALYIDGASAATSITGANFASLTAATDINIGRLRSANGYFAGSIDEVAVYNTVLSAATVLNHYQTGKRAR